MRTFLFCFALNLTFLISFGQSPGKIDFGDGHSGVYLIDFGELSMRTGQTTRDWLNPKLNNETLGSQFLDDFFSKGKLILKSDTMVEGVEMRYNIYAKHIQIKLPKDTLILIHPEKVRTLTFNGRTFIYDDFVNGESTGKDYFEILSDGNCRLLLYREIKLLKKNPPLTPMSPGTDFDRLDLLESFYLQRKGAPATFVKSNRKSILAFLSDHRVDLERFLEKEKIRFDQQADLVKLIGYYNSL